MAIDPGTATIIAAGLGAGSRLLGSGSQGWSQQGAYEYDWRKLHQQQRWTAQNMSRARQYALNDQLNSIQRKVADAKAAGLHPLYALGSSSPGTPSALPVTTTSGPVFPGQADTGSHAQDAIREIGRGIKAYASLPNKHEQQMERYERRLQQRLLESQIRETNARALSASTVSARAVDPGRPSPSDISGTTLKLSPVLASGVEVVDPRHQRPGPSNVMSNFMGFGDLKIPGGHTAGHVEEVGGEAMGLAHSLGLTVRAIAEDAFEELKWLGTAGKAGTSPWSGAPGERKKYRKGYRGRDGRIMR